MANSLVASSKTTIWQLKTGLSLTGEARRIMMKERVRLGLWRISLDSGRIGGATEVADSYTRPWWDGLEVSWRGLLWSGTGDHGLRDVGSSFIWQVGNHRRQVKVVLVKKQVN